MDNYTIPLEDNIDLLHQTMLLNPCNMWGSENTDPALLASDGSGYEIPRKNNRYKNVLKRDMDEITCIKCGSECTDPALYGTRMKLDSYDSGYQIPYMNNKDTIRIKIGYG